MKAPDAIPEAVRAAIWRYAEQHNDSPKALLAQLKFDPLMGCYFFVRAGMYHGVELDGHIHT